MAKWRHDCEEILYFLISKSNFQTHKWNTTFIHNWFRMKSMKQIWTEGVFSLMCEEWIKRKKWFCSKEYSSSTFFFFFFKEISLIGSLSNDRRRYIIDQTLSLFLPWVIIYMSLRVFLITTENTLLDNLMRLKRVKNINKIKINYFNK